MVTKETVEVFLIPQRNFHNKNHGFIHSFFFWSQKHAWYELHITVNSLCIRAYIWLSTVQILNQLLIRAPNLSLKKLAFIRDQMNLYLA